MKNKETAVAATNLKKPVLREVTGTSAVQTQTNTDNESEYSSLWAKELIKFDKLDWHSILVGEDLLVAALMKSLKRQKTRIPVHVAVNTVRDLTGELLKGLVVAGKQAEAGVVETFLMGKSGSGDDKFAPPPNP